MTVAVVACSSPRGGDVADLPAGTTRIVDLCSHPGTLGEGVDDADALVLLVHSDEVELSRMQAAIRKAGFDPFGVPLVDVVAAGGDAARLEVMVAGAAARAVAFTGSRAEQARPVMSSTMSRRSLLTLPRPHYEAVPWIDPTVCAAGDGCRLCVETCPQTAYQWVGGNVRFDKDACITCGRCVTTCPTGAIASPVVSPAGLRAEIEAIIEAAPSPGIAFSCAKAKRPVVEAGWYEVTVPCTGMVPAMWPVAALLLGAGAATIRPCSDAGCPNGFDELSKAAVAFARRLVDAAGFDGDVIPERPDVEPAAGREKIGLEDPFGVHGSVEVMLALASAGEHVDIRGDASPIGIITVDPAACTLCAMCAETCPTGALRHDYDEQTLFLSFDASLCTACSQCLPACPERERGAIALDRRVDSHAVDAGRVVVKETDAVTCEVCGDPIAPAATLDRITALLGEEHIATARYITTRCMNCRGVG